LGGSCFQVNLGKTIFHFTTEKKKKRKADYGKTWAWWRVPVIFVTAGSLKSQIMVQALGQKSKTLCPK
jgi:hypothetical protein